MAVKNALLARHVSNRRLGSVSFPVISSGIYGCPTSVCASTMLTVFKNYLDEHMDTSIHTIRVVISSKKKVDIFCKKVAKVF